MSNSVIPQDNVESPEELSTLKDNVETKDASEEVIASEVKEDEKKSEGQELTAAAALTSLNNNNDSDASEDEEEEEDAPADDVNFKIPLRLTKSGRRRATPFPLKVSLL